MDLSRSNVEESEKIICEYLTECSDPARQSSSVEAQIANELAEHLSGTVMSAEHIGNTYDSIGDILVHTDSGPKYCELKMLTGGLCSTGTSFNISPKTPIETGVFESDTLKWREFMQEDGHREFVSKQLQSYDHYPEDIHSKYSTKLQEMKTLGRYIRDLVDDSEYTVSEAVNDSRVPPEISQAAEIKTDIREFDRAHKQRYIEYLSTQQINTEHLKALTIIFAGGYHKKKQIHNYMDVVKEVSEEVGGVGNVFDDYRKFFAYIDTETTGVDLRTGNQQKAIETLSNQDSFDIQFGGSGSAVDQSNIEIGFWSDTDNFISVYRLSLNWGNVFQGIATPRMNGFEQEFFEKI